MASRDYPVPTIIADTREQDVLAIRGPTVREGLYSGDYSFVGGQNVFAVERKSLSDLVGSLTAERERFEREPHRLRGFRFARLLLVGNEADLSSGNYRSNAKPAALMASLAAFEVRYVPVHWDPTPEAAARRIEGWAYYFAREILRGADEITGCSNHSLKTKSAAASSIPTAHNHSPDGTK